MTELDFKNLPLLLLPQQARAVLNCNKETLTELRTSNPGLAVRLKGMRHYRYRKVMVAKIAGIKYE